MLKKLKFYTIIVALLIICTSCSRGKEAKSDMEVKSVAHEGTTLYLANKEKTNLAEEVVVLNGDNTHDQIEEIITYLGNGIEETENIPTLSSALELINYKIDDTNLVLNFSKSYNDLDALSEILSRTSLVKSLTELEGIDTVEIYIEEVPLKSSDGTPVGAMKEADIILSFPTNPNEEIQKKVLLYFANHDATHLVPIEVELNLEADITVERAVLNLLIEGPKNEMLERTIPEGIKVKDVFVSDSVCYVDFGEDFVNKHWGGSAGESLTIYSIVNTLTELPSISKVQFLIEGEKRETLKGHMQFDILFERNLDMIESQ